MNRYTKIEAELVVAPREVLEARPRSTPPQKKEEDRGHEDEERWDNAPCTD